MLAGEALGLFAGAIVLGAIHGVEPGHGWPVAASYALDQSNKWVYGFAASFILGVGHLVSSIAMVAAFFWAKSYFQLTQVNEPITVAGLTVGAPVSLVAGVLLIALGIREYVHGHSHGDDGGHDHGGHSHEDDHDDDGPDAGEHGVLERGPVANGHGVVGPDLAGDRDEHGRDHGHEHGHEHSHGHDHSHDHSHDHGHDHEYDHGHDHGGDGILARITTFVPFVGGHSHAHGDVEEAADRGLLGIAWFAFLLGFAHEEEFEIIALCAGSSYCLELMLAYALTVIVGIVALTLLLIAGYQHFEDRVEAYAGYLPVFSAVVLIVMGLGFVTGVF